MKIPEAENDNISEKVLHIFENKLGIIVPKSDLIAIYKDGQKKNNRPRHPVVAFRNNL